MFMMFNVSGRNLGKQKSRNNIHRFRLSTALSIAKPREKPTLSKKVEKQSSVIEIIPLTRSHSDFLRREPERLREESTWQFEHLVGVSIVL